MSSEAIRAGLWDALLKAAPSTRRVDLKTEGGQVKPATKLEVLLHELRQRDSATTLTLAVCAELTTNQVWGLLKNPRAIGQVRFDGERWSLVPEFAGRDVERAAALLREHGWRVEPPTAQEEHRC